jgi:hypothetical protein
MWKVEDLSSIAAIFYTSLFSISRRMASAFRTSNPTWIRLPTNEQERAEFSREEIEKRFISAVLASRLAVGRGNPFQRVACEVSRNDATSAVPAQSVDWVVTSPPYCTRIDYAAGTRIELALIAPLINVDADELRRRMIGTTVVPKQSPRPREEWGTKCTQFLEAVYNHTSKASKGYYYLTNVDYFDKMFRSLTKLASALKPKGMAVLVVQDSYYKDVHNDLPSIITDMSEACDLRFKKRADFVSLTCMSRINSRAAAHRLRAGSTESVLVFSKE